MPDSTTFQAKYPGQCGFATTASKVGEHVHYDDDELVHNDCGDDIGLTNTAGTACPDCWVIHAGECL